MNRILHFSPDIETLLSCIDCYNLSEIAGILPTKKSDLSSDEEKNDDPTSPYSVNYSGEFNKNKIPGAYALVLADKNGKQTGYLHVSSPGSDPTKLSWPRTDKSKH